MALILSGTEKDIRRALQDGIRQTISEENVTPVAEKAQQETIKIMKELMLKSSRQAKRQSGRRAKSKTVNFEFTSRARIKSRGSATRVTINVNSQTGSASKSSAGNFELPLLQNEIARIEKIFKEI